DAAPVVFRSRCGQFGDPGRPVDVVSVEHARPDGVRPNVKEAGVHVASSAGHDASVAVRTPARNCPLRSWRTFVTTTVPGLSPALGTGNRLWRWRRSLLRCGAT